MKIELKQTKLTWRELRRRYEKMIPVKGLKGINLLAAFDHNLKILKELTESSDFEKQFPASEKFKKYQKEQMEELKKIEGVKEEFTPEGMSYLRVNWNDQAVKSLKEKLELKYKAEFSQREKDSEAYEKLLDEEVPEEFTKFWRVSFSEAPADQEAYQAVSWMLKDVPDMGQNL